MRICSLLPSATEIVYVLGLGDSIVGVTHECDYPTQTKQAPVVVHSRIDPHHTSSSEINQSVTQHLKSNKGIYTLDMPRFNEADPDIILTQALCDVCALDYNEVVAAARSLPRRPQILSLNPSNLSEVFQDIVRVGEITGQGGTAENVVRGLEGRVQMIKNALPHGAPRPKVACIEWLDPLYSAGHWIPEMVEIAGGWDPLADTGQPSQQIPWSRIRDCQPDVVILMPCGFDIDRTVEELDLLDRLPGWNTLPAIKEDRLYPVNGHAYFNRPGPRLVDGLEILAQIIHPEIFPWTATSDQAVRLTQDK